MRVRGKVCMSDTQATGIKIGQICKAVAMMVLKNHIGEAEGKEFLKAIEEEGALWSVESPAMYERDGKRLLARGKARFELIKHIEKFFNDEIQEDEIMKKNRIVLVK